MDRKYQRGLTPKQRKFVEEYVADANAVQSYFRAFGRQTSKGVNRSYKAAALSAAHLLEDPRIAEEIVKANEEYQRRCRVSKDRTVKEVAALAFVDPGDAFLRDPNGGPCIPRPLHDIPVMTRRAISSVKVKRRKLKGADDETYEVEEVEYKFASKTDALEKLCKKLGFYNTDQSPTGIPPVGTEYLELPDNGRGDNPPPIIVE